MIKRGIPILILFLLCLTALPAAAEQGVDHKAKTIAIAGYDACTGKYGDYGLGDKRGQEAAVAEINAAGGIQAGPLKGYQLKLDFFDDRGDPKESANIARKVSASDYLLAIGPTMSSCALAATPVYYRNQVPNIITYSNATTITEQGFDNIVRLTYTTKSIAQYMADQVKNHFKKDTVAVISENQDYGQQLLKGFKEKAEELDIEVVTEAVVTPGQDMDFRALLMKARSQNPGMLMLFVTYNEAGMLVKQIRQLGWNVPIFAPDAMTEPKFFDLAGDLTDVYLELSPTVDINRPTALKLKQEWNRKYEGFPPLAAIYGYDAVKVAAAVIEKGAADRASFIEKMKTVEVKGVANEQYRFDETGEGKVTEFITIPAAQYYEENIKG